MPHIITSARLRLVAATVALTLGTIWVLAGAAPANRPAKPSTAVEPCATESCHPSIIQHKVMHGPTAQGKCLACHVYVEPREHTFRLASRADRLCADCHTLKNRTTVHAPVEKGNCTGCHDPHGSEHRTMLVGDATQGLCLSCHKQQLAEKKFIHGPVANGACILCHEPHSSWQPKLLTDAPQRLCLSCHSEMIPREDRARHVHAPARDNCVSCHDAHAADHKYQLSQTAPALCLSCHDDVRKQLSGSPVVHAAATQEQGCSSCHAPHFSQLPGLQRTEQPQMCLSCHNQPLKAGDGRTLTNMASLLRDNPQHHGPIREGECTACHQPHAGQRINLLVAEYPPEFYSAFKIEQYALCFKCHIPEMVLKPQAAGLTRFADGQRNLHWLHVNQEKGRTCRACHEVHASRNPFHIRDAVPFGASGWMLEIGYRQTATGGSCSPGCHRTMTYNRGGDEPAAPPNREVPNAPTGR